MNRYFFSRITVFATTSVEGDIDGALVSDEHRKNPVDRMHASEVARDIRCRNNSSFPRIVVNSRRSRISLDRPNKVGR